MYPLTHIFLSIMHSSACRRAVSVCAGAFFPAVKPHCEPGTTYSRARSDILDILDNLDILDILDCLTHATLAAPVVLLAGRPTRRPVSRFLACSGLGGQHLGWCSVSRQTCCCLAHTVWPLGSLLPGMSNRW